MFRYVTCFCFLIPAAYASVKVGGGVMPLDYRADHALAGALSFEVDGHEFRDASAVDPVFIRISLDQGVTLSRTLVLQSAADPVLQLPINLALSVDAADAGTVVAAADAVRIVRWVAGESDIWLEVRQSSDQWLSQGGSPSFPRADRPVRWTLGVSAQVSDVRNDAAAGTANLPFNTRVPASEGDFAQAVSTVLCVATQGSSLTDTGTQAGRLFVDFRALVEADQGNGSYGGGFDTGIYFGFKPLGLGVSRGHAASTPVLGDLATGTQGDLTTLQQEVSLTLQSTESGLSAVTELHPGAALTLTVDCPEVGFPLADGAAFNGLAGTVTADPASAVVVAGETLYREVTLVYTGAAIAGKSLPIALVFRPWYGPDAGASCSVTVSVALPNHGGAADEAPYDGADQACRCEIVTAGPDVFSLPLVLPAPASSTARR